MARGTTPAAGRHASFHHLVGYPADQEGVARLDVLGGATVQLLVGGHHLMIASVAKNPCGAHNSKDGHGQNDRPAQWNLPEMAAAIGEDADDSERDQSQAQSEVRAGNEPGNAERECF